MPDRSGHILSFAKVLGTLSFSTTSLGLLTIFSLIVRYSVKELTSKSIFHLGKLYSELESKENVLSLRPFVVFSFLDCCGITLLYWLRPTHDSIVMKLVEGALVRKCLSMNFEHFYSMGPAKNAARIYRNVSAIRDGTSILIFDLLGNAVVILSSLKMLRGMLEASIFACFSAALCALAVLQVLLLMTLSSLKKRCIEVSDSRAEEMNGFYENFVLAKVTNTVECRRMDPLFRSGVFLKYQILLSSMKFQSSLYFVVINVLVLYLSTRVKSFVFDYLKELALLAMALNDIIGKGFELESKRIEIEDMEQEDETNEVVRTRGTAQDPHTPSAISSTISSLQLSDISVFVQGTPILQHVDLKINTNDKIALIGCNGSGKSTFLRFLLGFLRYSGRASVDRQTVDLGSGILRNHISYLSQNKFFEGTILEILKEEIPSDDEIVAVCRKFGAHKFISDLPNGYETQVEELSQAQQQMINVIMVYSRRSCILLADEPTDCLDLPDRDSVMDILLGSDHHQIKVIILHNKEYICKFNRVFVVSRHTVRSYTLNAYMEMAGGTK